MWKLVLSKWTQPRAESCPFKMKWYKTSASPFSSSPSASTAVRIFDCLSQDRHTSTQSTQCPRGTRRSNPSPRTEWRVWQWVASQKARGGGKKLQISQWAAVGHNSVSCIYHWWGRAKWTVMVLSAVLCACARECVCVDKSQRKRRSCQDDSDTQRVHGLNSHGSLKSELYFLKNKKRIKKERHNVFMIDVITL